MDSHRERPPIYTEASASENHTSPDHIFGSPPVSDIHMLSPISDPVISRVEPLPHRTTGLQDRPNHPPHSKHPETTDQSVQEQLELHELRNDLKRVQFPRASDDSRTSSNHPPNQGLVKQPDSRPISQAQLKAEVRGIYAGLVMMEAKCVNVVNAQMSAIRELQVGGQSISLSQNPDHWQALVSLHRSLLHEHHDFFLASQHPSAGPDLRELATTYSMPGRMWKHAIHGFLELLRRSQPVPLDYMLEFIYLAYQMMALLYETVPSFGETWIECLGDLSRYRMAIEEDVSVRDVWTGVACYWYCKGIDEKPENGRLYHHLALLARKNALQQLSLYCRSLTSINLFPVARESIMTLFEHIITRTETSGSRIPILDLFYIKCHALIYTAAPTETYESTSKTFFAQVDSHISHIKDKWKDQGALVAISNIASLFEYGFTTSGLRQLFLHEIRLSSEPEVGSSTAIRTGLLFDLL